MSKQEKVIEYFKQISEIPRQSKKEEKIREFLINWAISKNFQYKTDLIWNLVIYIPSTPDQINNEWIILQAHMDMICVKEPNSNHNFEIDPIEVFEESWFLKARNTTLGADNWIWIALALACSELGSHPALELLFTVDEEQGMSWASSLDSSLLNFKKIINLDSEEEYNLCISSAWWAKIEIVKEDLVFVEPKYNQYEIKILWFKWWHSWVEINKNRWNAIKFVLKFLEILSRKNFDYELVSINWWVADNVIPKECKLIIWTLNLSELSESLEIFIKYTKLIYDCPDLNFEITELKKKQKIISSKDAFNLINNISSFKIWVYSMSKHIPNLVETSCNLWVFELSEYWLKAQFMPRSSNVDYLKIILNWFQERSKTYYLKSNINSEYDWWEQDPNSPFVQSVFELYKKYFWDKAHLEAIHAWLECWMIVSKLWKWAEAISIWPNLFDVHSINERCEIESVWKIFNILKEFLANEKN